MKNIKEQVAHAVGRLKEMMEQVSERHLTAEELSLLTFDELVQRILDMDAELHALKAKVRKARPKVTVEAAVRMILEDKETPNLNAALIADIIRTVFKRYGHDCKTSTGSVRWYITEKTQEWDIVPRKPPYEAITEEGTDGLDAGKESDA